MLQFVENLITKAKLENNLDEKPFNNLKYFRIKCFSFMGIAMAGLREFRFSKLCIRKSLALINKESEQKITTTSYRPRTAKTTYSDFTFDSSRDFSVPESKILSLLKIELLMNASDATHQIIKTFKEMKNIDYSILSDFKTDLDEFDEKERQMVLDCFEQRNEYAKEAYLQAKNLIDPNLRIQTTFNLAISLYDNGQYQSAAYYFNECLSISTILIKSPQDDEFSYMTDIRPDFHLESAVYLAKCQLIIDYCQTESSVPLTEDFQVPLNKQTEQPIETIYAKLLHSNEIICGRITKWKLNETNRTSFNFHQHDLGTIKPDKESERLTNLLNVCTDCLVYSCYRLNKFFECLFYSEQNKYLMSLDSNDYIERIVKSKNKNNKNQEVNPLGSMDDFKTILLEMNEFYLFFKFIFDAKLLYIFFVNEKAEIKYKYEIKLSLLYNINELNVSLYNRKFNGSELEYFTRKFELIQNEWIKNNLNYYETRDVPNSVDTDLKRIRNSSRLKEKKFHFNLNKPTELDLLNELAKNHEQKLTDLKTGQSTVTVTPMLHYDERQLEAEFESIAKNVLAFLFIHPCEEIFNSMNKPLNDLFINISIETEYAKLLVYIFNLKNQLNDQKIFYNIILDSFLLPANSKLISVEKEEKKLADLEIKRNEILNTPKRAKPISKQNDLTNSIKIPKTNISPRNTSHPRLAHCMLNEDPDKDYILVRNDHLQKTKNRLDSAISTLISNTFSNADTKRSYLEVTEFKQIHKIEKCTAIGCPEVPRAYYTTPNRIEKFLVNGLEQLSQISQLMYINPIFSTRMTKQEVLNQMETSAVLFLSTLSTNESDSAMICSETPEYPNSIFEIDKYCKINSADLNTVRMHECKLLILNCFAIVHHRARFRLAKKLLAVGCQNVLIVLTPMPHQLMTKFYLYFIENLKKEQTVSIAYTDALLKMVSILSTNILKHFINASFCLISSKHSKICINDIAKSMIQTKIDRMIDETKLNEEPKLSIMSVNFKPLMEKTLIDLQILFKLLLNQLIDQSLGYTSFKSNELLKNIFYYMYDLVSKSLSYTKNDKTIPEKLSDLIETNVNAKNILLCLGFNCIQSMVFKTRDQNDKLFVSMPDKRFLDLNIRAVHILSALIEVCFEKSIDTRSSISEKSENSINQEIRIEASYMNQFYNDKKANSNTDEKNEIKIKSIIFNLQALLPIYDRNLLTALIDILALTKFSSEIILSLSDQSVYYAFNYYEKNSKFHNNIELIDLIDKDIFTWSNRIKNYYSENDLPNDQVKFPLDYSFKFSINNKVANFLFSIGFEIVGNWLRFNDIEFNRRIIDLMLKFLTSFALDRDMTLYKDL